MELEALPVKDGFRLRGEAVTRLETFVDAAFAFAVTLLVVSFDRVPGTFAELMDAVRRVPAFLAGFAMLATFWAAHDRFSRRFGLEDGTVLVLSLSLVAVVLVYIFPLRILMAAMMAFFTGGWAPTELHIDNIADLRALYLVYGGGFLAMNALLVALNHHGMRRAEALRLDALERWLARAERDAFLLLGTPALLSIALALALPMTAQWQFAAPGLVYGLLGVIMPWYGVRTSRTHRRLLASRHGAIAPSENSPVPTGALP
jgi:uncharacterized membrane protein